MRLDCIIQPEIRLTALYFVTIIEESLEVIEMEICSQEFLQDAMLPEPAHRPPRADRGTW
jgi:hypothetical protein